MFKHHHGPELIALALILGLMILLTSCVDASLHSTEYLDKHCKSVQSGALNGYALFKRECRKETED